MNVLRNKFILASQELLVLITLYQPAISLSNRFAKPWM